MNRKGVATAVRFWWAAKEPVPLKAMPVGPAGVWTVIRSGSGSTPFAPDQAWEVAVLLLLIHAGVEGPRAIPHGFDTR